MAKFFFIMLAVVCMYACQNGTNDDIEITGPIYPFDIRLDVKDEQGYNLLDYKVEGNFVNDTIVATFGKNISKVVVSTNYISTSNIDGNDMGLIIKKEGTDYKKILYFGSFWNTLNYEIDDIVLAWPDGSKDTIGISNSFFMDKDMPEIKRFFYLNGKIIDNNGHYTFIKKKN